MTPENILVLAAAGDRTAREAASEILLRGIGTYLRLAGEIPLERCCGLPGPSAKKRIAQMQRDYHLARAYQQCAGPNKADQLAGEIRDFLSRIWPSWSAMDAPPPTASELRSDLFQAVLACPENFPESSRQLRRIVGEVGQITTTRLPSMKSMQIIDRESRLEFSASQALRDEFNTEEQYVAFRRAESEGRISWFTKSAEHVSKSVPSDKFP